MQSDLKKIVVDAISEFALRALLYEVSASPKPGLVDRFGSGAHRDMDFYTFMNSAAALGGYFRECAQVGVNLEVAVDEMMPHLRPLGIEAEKRMLIATGGVNTHKGLIYAMGLLSAAGARICFERKSTRVEQSKWLEMLGESVKQMVLPEMTYEISCLEKSETYGGEQYKTLGILGARGEALSGYEKARCIGVVALNESIREKHLALNEALLYSLMKLCLVIEDSNVIGRHNLKTLRESQMHIQRVLEEGHFLNESGRKAYEGYCEWCRLNRISHGGAADMLAIAYFMYSLSEWEETRTL